MALLPHPRVFIDNHHAGLSRSFRLLIERRLGGTCFFPIGEDWFTEGYWKIAEPYKNNPATVKQYLSLDQTYVPEDHSPPLNRVRSLKRNYFEIRDVYHGDTLKAITFEQFKNTDIDIIIASIPAHWYMYKKLRDTYKPKAKVVAHAGNMFAELPKAIEDGIVVNLFASIKPFKVGGAIPVLFYHQEFPVVPFVPPDYARQKEVSSFVHCLPFPEVYETYKRNLTEYEFHSYGGSCPDGWMPTLELLYRKMRDSLFIYHVKPGGDGYGHNFYNSFMLGRPILTNFSDYDDKLGAELFEHGVTGLDLEQHSMRDNYRLIREYSEPEKHAKLCENARRRFIECVDFEAEGEKAKSFFHGLI